MVDTLNPPPLDVPALLRRFGLRPDKRLGQNFLVDPDALQRIVQAAGIQEGDSILEIGPGLGSLTRYLAAAARSVTAVELDARLIPPLEHVLEPYPNVRIVEGDILALDPAELMGESVPEGPSSPGGGEPRYVVVANIPYYITSPLIRRLLEASLRPQSVTLTVQREVAERITAGPGEMSLLALSVQVYGNPEIVARIPAGAFYPVPQVDSAVVRVELYPAPRFNSHVLDEVFRVAKAGFSQKRKMLRNAIAAGLRLRPSQAEVLLASAGIDSSRRAETLSLDEWEALAAALEE